MKCEKHKAELEDVDCWVCGGDGVIEDDNDGMFLVPEYVICWQCNGKGFVPNCRCCLCEEEAEVTENGGEI